METLETLGEGDRCATHHQLVPFGIWAVRLSQEAGCGSGRFVGGIFFWPQHGRAFKLSSCGGQLVGTVTTYRTLLLCTILKLYCPLRSVAAFQVDGSIGRWKGGGARRSAASAYAACRGAHTAESCDDAMRLLKLLKEGGGSWWVWDFRLLGGVSGRGFCLLSKPPRTQPRWLASWAYRQFDHGHAGQPRMRLSALVLLSLSLLSAQRYDRCAGLSFCIFSLSWTKKSARHLFACLLLHRIKSGLT